MNNKSISFYHSLDTPTTPDNVSWAPHLHSNYEILFVYSVEEAYFNISGFKYQLKSFDFVFIKPATIHNLTIPHSQNYERCGIYFSENMIPDELKPAVNDFNRIYHFEKNDPVFKVIDSVSDAEQKFSEDDFQAFLPSALTQILYHLKYLSADDENVGISNDVIDKIIRYIDEHITEPLNAEVISEKFFVSKSWLSHNFKNYLGMSLKKYINQKKLLTIEKLIPTGLSLTHLSEGYSYNNYVTFFRQYKQYTGKKPKDNKLKDAKPKSDGEELE